MSDFGNLEHIWQVSCRGCCYEERLWGAKTKPEALAKAKTEGWYDGPYNWYCPACAKERDLVDPVIKANRKAKKAAMITRLVAMVKDGDPDQSVWLVSATPEESQEIWEEVRSRLKKETGL